MTTDELGLLVMRFFYQYKCTDLVLDTGGQGLGVYDFIIKNQYDPEYDVTYEALTCCNNEDMADRCKVRNAKRLSGLSRRRQNLTAMRLSVCVPDSRMVSSICSFQILKPSRKFKRFAGSVKCLSARRLFTGSVHSDISSD